MFSLSKTQVTLPSTLVFLTQLRLLSSAILRIFSLTRARESVGPAKFLIAGEPAAACPASGADADGPEAFTVDEAVADRFRSAVRRLAWVRLGANRRFRQKSNDFNAR